MAGELLADSDFYIALYKRDDANHEHALKLLERIGEMGSGLALSVFVYSETATVLSQRVGQVVARNFMQDLEGAGVRLIHMSEQLFEKTKKTFRAQRSKNVSFTDASNVALMTTGEFDALVSFDKDYHKNNVQLFT